MTAKMSVRSKAGVRSSQSSRSKAIARPARKSLIEQLGQLQIRQCLVLAAISMAILAGIVASRTLDVYDSAYQMFNGIVQQNSVRVDAAEQALQHIASAGASAADFSSAATNSATHQTALTSIYTEFAQFRDNMFTLHADLNSDGQTTYNAIEQAVYNEFWPQIGLAIAAEQKGDSAAARTAYLNADNSLAHEITPGLQRLETTNFAEMKSTEQTAGGEIVAESVVLAGMLLVLAGLLTGLSFWVRTMVRRLFTPGIDAAMILAWIVALGTISQLFALPEAMRSMVEDAYYSVTASSRVLDVANLSNRTESTELLDLDHVAFWEQAFDKTKAEIELRLCGQIGCLNHTFTPGGDILDAQAYQTAKAISKADSLSIGGIVPLVANVTYAGEAQTLETARKAYLDYLAIDGQIRQLIQSNQIASAIRLNTGIQPGQSDEAFGRFVTAMEHEKAINRAYFDGIWQTEQTALLTNRIGLGLAGNGLVIVLLAVGVYHRYREL